MSEGKLKRRTGYKLAEDDLERYYVGTDMLCGRKILFSFMTFLIIRNNTFKKRFQITCSQLCTAAWYAYSL